MVHGQMRKRPKTVLLRRMCFRSQPATPTCPFPNSTAAAGTGTLRAEMLDLDSLDTDAERNIISVAEDLDLRDHLYAIAFSERLDQAIRPTDCYLNGARVVSQREREGPTLPAQFLLTRPCEVDDAYSGPQFLDSRLRW